MPEGERPPVDWRKRHVVLGGLTERVQRLSRPDEEWLDAPAPSAAAPARGPRSERASVEEALRILAESRVKVKGVRYTVYEPKTLRLRGTADAPATVEAAESPVKPSKPTDAATAAAPEQEHTVEAPFAHAKLARSPRQHGTHALPMSPLASLFTLRSPAEVDDQWQLVQQQHLERKQAAAIKYSKYSATPGGASPLTPSFSSSSLLCFPRPPGPLLGLTSRRCGGAVRRCRGASVRVSFPRPLLGLPSRATKALPMPVGVRSSV